MTPAWIVEPFDIVEHVCPQIIPGPVVLLAQALGLQRREEAFHCSVVPAVTATADAANNAMGFEQALEILARIGSPGRNDAAQREAGHDGR